MNLIHRLEHEDRFLVKIESDYVNISPKVEFTLEQRGVKNPDDGDVWELVHLRFQPLGCCR